MQHLAILIPASVPASEVIADLYAGLVPGLPPIGTDGAIELSAKSLAVWIDQEYRHGQSDLTRQGGPLLSLLSSGQRRWQAFLHLLEKGPRIFMVVDPWEHLDATTRVRMLGEMKSHADHILWILLLNTPEDIPDFVDHRLQLTSTHPRIYEAARMEPKDGLTDWSGATDPPSSVDTESDSRDESSPLSIPPAPAQAPVYVGAVLVEARNLSVSYGAQPVIRELNWTIRAGESWLLKGPNGSGKSTLIGLISGDNPKGYGQDLTLFGRKKGEGASVWDIKRMIGYFTPGQLERFGRQHTVLQMLVSGFRDSVGLYSLPTDEEHRLSLEWLHLIGYPQWASRSFSTLTFGQQHLIMTLRALVKHPPLLILDEPVLGLSRPEALFYGDLIKRFCETSKSALVWVTHEDALTIHTDRILELIPGSQGSTGRVI